MEEGCQINTQIYACFSDNYCIYLPTNTIRMSDLLSYREGVPVPVFMMAVHREIIPGGPLE